MIFWNDPLPFLSQWLSGLLSGWGVSPLGIQLISYILGGGLLAVGALLLVLFLIWVERKVVGRMQDRLGPNRIGPWGIFQTIADMLKIFTKEHITPDGADRIPYNLAPVLSVASVLMVWAVLPFMRSFYGADLSVAVLYVVAVGTLGEMGVILAGWGSNNKYALMGAFRSVALLVSYEIPMVVVLLVPVMLSGSMSLTKIVQSQNLWFVLVAPLPALIFFIAMMAEMARAPFDLVEADSELVSGFNIEYSGLKFGMFYVADFLHAFTISLLFSTLFLGGWRGPWVEQVPLLGFFYFFLKTSVVYLTVIWVRGTLPRFRLDQMNDLNWKLLTPFSLLSVLAIALVDKLIPGQGFSVWRVLALLAANLGVGALLLLALRRFSRRRKPAVVTSNKYKAPVPQKRVSA